MLKNKLCLKTNSNIVCDSITPKAHEEGNQEIVGNVVINTHLHRLITRDNEGHLVVFSSIGHCGGHHTYLNNSRLQHLCLSSLPRQSSASSVTPYFLSVFSYLLSPRHQVGEPSVSWLDKLLGLLPSFSAFVLSKNRGSSASLTSSFQGFCFPCILRACFIAPFLSFEIPVCLGWFGWQAPSPFKKWVVLEQTTNHEAFLLLSSSLLEPLSHLQS